MIGVNNFIYTENGIYSMKQLFEEYTYRTSKSLELTKLATLNTTTLKYEFVANYDIIKKPVQTDDELIDLDIQDFEQLYECRFNDLFSNKLISINCTEDTYILQYNIISNRVEELNVKKYGVLKYIIDNKSNIKIDIGWRPFNTLINYSTHMPNIVLGDIMTIYRDKSMINREQAFNIIKKDKTDTIPVFVCQNVSNVYNFILVKTNPNRIS